MLVESAPPLNRTDGARSLRGPEGDIAQPIAEDSVRARCSGGHC